MKYILSLLVCTCAFFGSASAQHTMRVMFYNTENFFDTVDNPNKEDEEFLPKSPKEWNQTRYWQKQKQIAAVITAVGELQPVALVGMCEVENDSVLYDLTMRSPLQQQTYQYIISPSPDNRGISNALLYQPEQFSPVATNHYEVDLSPIGASPTRNILHVAGRVVGGDTLDVFVCHFPSKRGGASESEPKRIITASILRQKIDSLQQVRRHPNIIVMGDFNDSPNSVSMTDVLQAKEVGADATPSSLHNLMLHRMNESTFGSYFFQGKWDALDQFVVNGALLSPNNSISVKDNAGLIYKADFLLQLNKYNQKQPFRTYAGPRYLGGFSDHLPIYLDLIVRKRSR